jgi:acetyl esterase/lipase
MVSEEMRGFLSSANQKTRKDTNKSIHQQRAELDAFMADLEVPAEVDMSDFKLAGRPARRYTPPGARTDRGILCFHGGGYRVGSLNAYNSFMSHLAIACEAPVTGLDYRLAPEHTYPAALDDAVAAFVELSASMASENIMIIGDSAGGSLTLSCLLKLKEQNLPLAGCATLLSANTDFTCSGDSYGERRAEFKEGLKAYAGDHPMDTVGLSPLFGDHAGLPPLLIHVASDESMLDDSTQLQERAVAAGVDSQIQIFDDAFHVFQIFTNIPEAREAIAAIGTFFQKKIGD